MISERAIPDPGNKVVITKIGIDENFIIWLLYKVTFPIAKLLTKVEVSPNFITTTGFLFGGSAGYLIINEYSYFYIAVVWYSAILLDLIDGQVARMSNKVRNHSFGYDHMSDLLKISIFLISMGLKYSSKSLWPVTAICLVSIYIADKLNNDISISRSDFKPHPKNTSLPNRSRLLANTYTIFFSYNTHTLFVFPFLLLNLNFAIYFLTYLIGISTINCFRFVYILIRLPRNN